MSFDNKKTKKGAKMSKLIITLAKVVLFVSFMHNLGVWSFIGRAYNAPHNSITPEQVMKIEKFTVTLVSAAENKVRSGKTFFPDEYFATLQEIERYAKSIGVKSWSNFRVNRLQSVLQDQVSRGKLTFDQISKAAERYRLSLEGEIVKDRGIDFQAVCTAIIGFLGEQYKYNLLIGLSLLILWLYQKNGSFRLRNPFSLAIAVIFYPFVIGFAWYQGLRSFARGVYGESLARRFKSRVFDILSEDEIGAVRKFASGKIDGIKLRQALSNNKSPQRGWVIAILAALLLLIVPRSLTAATNSGCEPSYKVVMTDIADPGGSILSSEFLAEDQNTDCCYQELTELKNVSETVEELLVFDKIDHVPWLLSCWQLLIQQLKQTKKEDRHEESYNNIRNYFISI